MKALMIALSILSSGCTATPPEDQVPVHGGEGCDAAPAQKLIGREATSEVGAEAIRLTGAGTMRWLPEGSIVTMEYRGDRLNLHLDRRNRIVRINCG